jgi:hypothetical protein
LQPHALAAKRDAGAATPAKYFFVRLEPLHFAKALFEIISYTVLLMQNDRKS